MIVFVFLIFKGSLLQQLYQSILHVYASEAGLYTSAQLDTLLPGGGDSGPSWTGCVNTVIEKTHFEGIQYVKIIPIMNGLTILCTHKEWIASLLHHPHRDFVYIIIMLTKYHNFISNGMYYFLFMI